jgi:hypothetical protein
LLAATIDEKNRLCQPFDLTVASLQHKGRKKKRNSLCRKAIDVGSELRSRALFPCVLNARVTTAQDHACSSQFV